jgi:nucleotide-binding universal stress UspA family protein
MKYERILIVADDHPSTLKAAKSGYELAAQLSAKVALIGVVDQALTNGNPDAGVFPGDLSSPLKKHMVELLNKIEQDYSNGLDTEKFAPEGRVNETILQMSREWDAQLIVVGTRGRKGLDLALHGSKAQDILKKSKIPVLIVPIEKD